jgi:GntR family transcriptional regulator
MLLALMKEAPLYKKVKASIVESLTRNEWRLGERIPTEPELASRYGVGISTVRAAVSELEQLGVLSRQQGKGTFVVVPSRHTDLHRFFRIAPIDGERSNPESELLSFKRKKADAATADLLRLPPSRNHVFWLRNLMRLQGEPVAVSEFAIPERLFPKLSKRMFLEAALPPFGFYQKLYGVSIIRTLERLFAIAADKLAAAYLPVKAGAPILEVHRIAYTFDDVPVEFRRIQVLTHRHCYFFEEGGTS